MDNQLSNMISDISPSSSEDSNLCKIPNCLIEAHSICKCAEILLCRNHLFEHLEIVTDATHKPESLYLKIDGKDTDYIRDIVTAAKGKLQADYAKIVKSSDDFIQDFTKKITENLSRLQTLQNSYVAALESVLINQRIARNSQRPILINLQTNFQKFKENISKIN